MAGSFTEANAAVLLDVGQNMALVSGITDAGVALSVTAPTTDSDGYALASPTTRARVQVATGGGGGDVAVWLYDEEIDAWAVPNGGILTVLAAGGIAENINVASFQRIYVQDLGAGAILHWIKNSVI